ncbi:MAG: hypothetical protein ACNA7W_21710 [Pseudomonadales bacterium]
MLTQTVELLDDDAVAGRLREALGGEPLVKPADHRGGGETDMFRVRMSLAEAQVLLATVERAVARGAATSGTRKRGLGGFVEAWREYLQHLERGGGDAGVAGCSARF